MTSSPPLLCPYCNGQGCSCDDGEIQDDLTLSQREQLAEGASPSSKWERGECPDCKGTLISRMYNIRGKGQLLVWVCQNSEGENPTCGYRRVL